MFLSLLLGSPPVLSVGGFLHHCSRSLIESTVPSLCTQKAAKHSRCRNGNAWNLTGPCVEMGRMPVSLLFWAVLHPLLKQCPTVVGGQAWPLRGLSASAWNALGRHQLLCTSFTLMGLPLPSHRQSSVCFITHTWAPQNPLYWDSPRNYTSWGAADRQEQERKLRSFCSFRPSFSIYQALATCQILCWGSGGTEVKNLAVFDKPLNWVRLPKMMALRDEGREEWSQTSLSRFAGLSEGIADSW